MDYCNNINSTCTHAWVKEKNNNIQYNIYKNDKNCEFHPQKPRTRSRGKIIYYTYLIIPL